MNKKPTVIYIVSDRRSGSTLLENMLSKSAETTSVGELAMLKGHILKQGPGERWNWTCSCGAAVQQCSFWAPVLQQTYDRNAADFNTNIAWNFKSKKMLVVALLPFLFRNRLLGILRAPRNSTVQETLYGVYKAIFTNTGKPFIVDSSKDPLQALCIYRGKRDFDVKIIWLKRDLRAVAVSKSKWKELNVKKQKTLGKLLLDVFYFRRICKAVTGYFGKDDMIVMEYEALATQTQQQLDRVTGAFGLQSYTAPAYMLAENDHTIGGTPNRFEKRPIKYEVGWKQAYTYKKILFTVGAMLNKL